MGTNKKQIEEKEGKNEASRDSNIRNRNEEERRRKLTKIKPASQNGTGTLAECAQSAVCAE